MNKPLNDLLIDVDYHPCDPGNSTWYCERTRIRKDALLPGKYLRFKDPGGLFSAIKVVEANDDALVISYEGDTFTLDRDNPARTLDEDGRDYTEFELNVSARFAIRVENTPAFFRRFSLRGEVAQLTPADIDCLKDSDDPCAKYLLGRWHIIMAPENEASAGIAEGLFREAADAGIADAVASLSTLYAHGMTEEDRVDLDESARLRDKAIGMGSETAVIRYARNRICGSWLAPEEPEAVAAEIEERIGTEADINPEWYSVLGFAYEILGKDEAEDMYRMGIEKGCVRCYGELAMWYEERGNREEYRRWMEAGIEKGCGICFLLDCDYPEDKFEEFGEADRALLSNQVRDRLERGLKLGEEPCAYWLGLNYYHGYLGFPKDGRKGSHYLSKAIDMGDGFSCKTVAEILECDPDDVDRKIAARLRLYALRRGCNSEREKVMQAYRDGLLDEYKEEIEQYWLEDDEPEDDPGRWDAYV